MPPRKERRTLTFMPTPTPNDLKPVIRILLVEDNPADAHLTMQTLLAAIPDLANARHLELDHAWNGEEAWKYLEASLPRRPDLVILDLKLPKKSGQELLQDIKRDPRLQAIPVVIFTTSREEAEIFGAYTEFASCYVCKPMELADFRAVVRALAAFWMRECVLPSVA